MGNHDGVAIEGGHRLRRTSSAFSSESAEEYVGTGDGWIWVKAHRT
jgi:hypothetical protein